MGGSTACSGKTDWYELGENPGPGNQAEEAAKLLHSRQVWKGMGGNIKTLNLTLQVGSTRLGD